MQEKVPPQRPLPNASGYPLHDLPHKSEDDSEGDSEGGEGDQSQHGYASVPLELVGEALGPGDYFYDTEAKELAVKRRCWCFGGTLFILLVFLLSEYYYNRIFTYY
tara:strand:- start:953 stop:1270 length:318 start_codon:yes stop_codon:yes gene_type:complete